MNRRGLTEIHCELPTKRLRSRLQSAGLRFKTANAVNSGLAPGSHTHRPLCTTKDHRRSDERNARHQDRKDPYPCRSTTFFTGVVKQVGPFNASSASIPGVAGQTQSCVGELRVAVSIVKTKYTWMHSCCWNCFCCHPGMPRIWRIGPLVWALQY